MKIHSSRNLLLCIFLSFCVCVPGQASSDFRIGTLSFGTVNWELNTVKEHRLDRENTIRISVTTFAGNLAAKIALNGGEVDAIVSDWIWVSRMRNSGRGYTFLPFTSALGAVMVPANSALDDVSGLQGVRLGVAGGALDKSWLLLQAFTLTKLGFDITKKTEFVYAAPPLINGQMARGKFDAGLNYWHYSARLEALGYRRLIEVRDMLYALRISQPPPLVGYVFREDFARANPGIISGFSKALSAARSLLRSEESEWERLKPLMKISGLQEFHTLRKRYLEGIPNPVVPRNVRDAKKLIRILHKFGGSKLVGDKAILAPGTFWGVSEALPS